MAELAHVDNAVNNFREKISCLYCVFRESIFIIALRK